jgi:hypothetical protein
MLSKNVDSDVEDTDNSDRSLWTNGGAKKGMFWVSTADAGARCLGIIADTPVVENSSRLRVGLGVVYGQDERLYDDEGVERNVQ